MGVGWETVIERLPRTMAASMREQLARVDLLFPVERRLLDGRLDWLAKLGRADFERLFRALRTIESRMRLPSSIDEARGSIEQSAIIARSPLYPEWRREAERVFSVIDAGMERTHPGASVPRLLLLVLPAGLPGSTEPWRELPAGALRLSLEREFGEIQEDLLAAVAHRECPKELEDVERTWIIACEPGGYLGLTRATLVTWEETSQIRRKFLDRLNDVNRTLHSVDETMSSLEHLNLNGLLPPRLTADIRIREFVRSLLLSGNGSLVINNSFVQWCASEALRRAQPQALVAAFGIRDRPKPFSSLAWFEDQSRGNPAADAPDPAGSLADDEMLSRYVYLTARRLAPYSGRTLVWFAVEDRKSAVLLPPEKADRLPEPGRTVSASQVRDCCLGWLAKSS